MNLVNCQVSVVKDMSNQQEHNANKEHNQFGIKFPTAYITGIIKVLYLRCLNLKLQGPKLEKCRSYRIVRNDPLTTKARCDPT